MRPGSSLSRMQETYSLSEQSTWCYILLSILLISLCNPYTSQQCNRSLPETIGHLLMFSDSWQNCTLGCSTSFGLNSGEDAPGIRLPGRFTCPRGRSVREVTWTVLTNQNTSITFHFCPFRFCPNDNQKYWGLWEISVSNQQWRAVVHSHYPVNSECPGANAKPLPIILFSFQLMISLEIS